MRRRVSGARTAGREKLSSCGAAACRFWKERGVVRPCQCTEKGMGPAGGVRGLGGVQRAGTRALVSPTPGPHPVLLSPGVHCAGASVRASGCVSGCGLLIFFLTFMNRRNG